MSNGQTKTCSSCQMEVPKNAKKCPHCQSKLGSWFWRHPIGTALLAFFALPIVITMLLPDKKTENETTAASSATSTQVTQRPENQKGALKQAIKETEEFNGEELRKKQENGEQTTALDAFERWGELVAEGKKSSNPEVVELAKNLEKKASAIQVKEFPLIRKITIDRLGKVLWAKDITVKGIGQKNDTIEFVGAMFAANQNILDLYQPASETFMRLRFKEVIYRWSEGADGTKFVHTENPKFPKDGDVVGRYISE